MMELSRDEDTRHLVLTHYGTSLLFNALEEEDLRDWLSRPVPEHTNPTPSPRRLENRVATLEERVRELEDVVSVHKVWMSDLVRLNKETNTTHYDLPTPDQPVAPRIDPDDEALWEVVHPFLCDPATGGVMPSFLNGRGKAMLIAIAKHVNETSNG